MSLVSQIESILFVASKPLSFKTIAKAAGASEDAVREAVQSLIQKYNRDDSGIHLLVRGDEAQMGTNPAHVSAVEQFVRDEAAGELTRAQLETLTVIAYRGPATRPEVEQIRGVNCAVIIRNLMVRGLIDEAEDAEKLAPVYTLSFDAMRHLGIRKAEELPEYDTLHAHAHMERVLENEQNEGY